MSDCKCKTAEAERKRIIKSIKRFGRKEYDWLMSQPMGEAHWAYIQGIENVLKLVRGDKKNASRA
jgi:hypothetical protein